MTGHGLHQHRLLHHRDHYAGVMKTCFACNPRSCVSIIVYRLYKPKQRILWGCPTSRHLLDLMHAQGHLLRSHPVAWRQLNMPFTLLTQQRAVKELWHHAAWLYDDCSRSPNTVRSLDWRIDALLFCGLPPLLALALCVFAELVHF